jgi:hypothetical protein
MLSVTERKKIFITGILLWVSIAKSSKEKRRQREFLLFSFYSLIS